MKTGIRIAFRLARVFSFLLIATMPASSQDLKVQRVVADESVRINSDLVSLTVSVTDSTGIARPGLEKSAFTVFDGKVPQRISFFADDDAPASVAVVFDTSGSMSGSKIERAKEALARFMEMSDKRDEFFLIDFNSSARLLLDKTRDGDALLDKLTYVQPHGNTALYDAVYLGVEAVMRGAYHKRAIILISDGEDNDSRYRYNFKLSSSQRSARRQGNVGRVSVGIRRQSFFPKECISDERSV